MQPAPPMCVITAVKQLRQRLVLFDLTPSPRPVTAPPPSDVNPTPTVHGEDRRPNTHLSLSASDPPHLWTRTQNTQRDTANDATRPVWQPFCFDSLLHLHLNAQSSLGCRYMVDFLQHNTGLQHQDVQQGAGKGTENQL